MTDLSKYAGAAKQFEALQDIENSAFDLQHDCRYPVDGHGSVLDMNQFNHLHPDVLPALIHHLIKCGWRRVEEKRLIKARPVKAAGFYEDLVTWVPYGDPDGPIECDQPAPVSDFWSVIPKITESFEERS